MSRTGSLDDGPDILPKTDANFVQSATKSAICSRVRLSPTAATPISGISTGTSPCFERERRRSGCKSCKVDAPLRERESVASPSLSARFICLSKRSSASMCAFNAREVATHGAPLWNSEESNRAVE